MIAVEEIRKMSPIQKLKTMELLWDSLSEKEGQVPSPAWHKAVLSERLEKIRSGKARFLTLEQVKRRLRA
jgi:putative addiction module component (TIGR02574 family)